MKFQKCHFKNSVVDTLNFKRKILESILFSPVVYERAMYRHGGNPPFVDQERVGKEFLELGEKVFRTSHSMVLSMEMRGSMDGLWSLGNLTFLNEY